MSLLQKEGVAKSHFEGHVAALNGASHQPIARNGGLRDNSTPHIRNTILAALPRDVWARLEPQMRRMLLHQRDVIQESGAPAKYAYFIESGMVSLVVDSHDVSQVEIGVTGHEGLVGGLCVWGQDESFHRAIVQVPGSAFRLPAEVLREECRGGGVLQTAIGEYSQLLMVQASQSALCNRLHTVEERLCRWLLTMRDRIQSDNLELTHEFIAHMLGTRRSGVTVALGILQQAGMVDMTRGRITLTGNAQVESCACECYDIIRRQFEGFENKTFV